MVVGILSFLVMPLISPSFPFDIGGLLSVLLLMVPYALSRTKYYPIATALLLLLTTFAIAQPVISAVDDIERVESLHFMTLIILLASLLLTKRWVIVVTGLANIGLIGAYLFDHRLTSYSPLILMVVSSILLLVFMNNRDTLEQERQKELVGALSQAEQAVQAELRTNAELETKNRQLEEATRLKSEFLSTMSHELRTPLNAIRGFTGILLTGMGGDIDEEARYMLSRVDTNSDHLLALIDDVLDISKIESGRMEIINESLDTHNLITHWQDQMSVLANQKELEFEVNIDPALPNTIVGDGQHISQIAINLLSNAFKFTAQGKVTLSVHAAGDQWMIRVTDTGIGIPPHALNYIFEAFRQVDGSSKRQYGGTGLGLAIVRNLCQMMGGSISVKSELGVGSEFIVTLPVDASKK
jgi:signal transduction histidine kinase